MPSIVSYDVSDKQYDLKEELFKLGYLEKIKGNKCPIIYLPNSTVYHKTKSPLQARIDIQNICKQLKITLERCVATPWTRWAGVCGKPAHS